MAITVDPWIPLDFPSKHGSVPSRVGFKGPTVVFCRQSADSRMGLAERLAVQLELFGSKRWLKISKDGFMISKTHGEFRCSMVFRISSRKKLPKHNKLRS